MLSLYLCNIIIENDFNKMANIFGIRTNIKQQRCQLPLKGKGALLWDENNKEYIDAIASWWVNPMGIRIHLSPMPFTSN
jgi:adenosylmethionine-8-amino-7-oxononanoate aminotransferase